jgi:hypothetical protein
MVSAIAQRNRGFPQSGQIFKIFAPFWRSVDGASSSCIDRRRIGVATRLNNYNKVTNSTISSQQIVSLRPYYH